MHTVEAVSWEECYRLIAQMSEVLGMRCCVIDLLCVAATAAVPVVGWVSTAQAGSPRQRWPSGLRSFLSFLPPLVQLVSQRH